MIAVESPRYQASRTCEADLLAALVLTNIETPPTRLGNLLQPALVAMPSLQKSLWTCPRCGHQFVSRNIWHSCGRYDLADHFVDKDPALRPIFDRLVDITNRCGPAFAQARNLPQPTAGSILMHAKQMAGGKARDAI